MASAPSCRRRACWSSRRRCRRPGRSVSSTRTWRPPRDDDFAWAEVVFVSGMHVQRRQIDDIARRAHAARPGRGAGRLFGVGLPGALSGLRLSARRRVGRRHRRTVRAARRRCDAAAAADRLHHQGAARAHRIPDPGLRTGADRPLSARQHPVLQRLPVSVRILRHPGAVRPRRALQDGRAGLRRARQAGGLRTVRPRSISSTTISSPTSARCARCCRI